MSSTVHPQRSGLTVAAPEAFRDDSVTSAAGNRVLMFGTSVNFRTHPVGMFSQIARGLFWAGPAGAEVPAP